MADARGTARDCPAQRADRAAAETGDAATVLVEDLTLLLANLMAEDERQAERRAMAEVALCSACDAHVILVSNEVGMGIVPPYPLGRLFRDALGTREPVGGRGVWRGLPAGRRPSAATEIAATIDSILQARCSASVLLIRAGR